MTKVQKQMLLNNRMFKNILSKLIMKTLLLFIALNLSSSYAFNSYSQHKINIEVNNVSIETLLKKIQEKSEFNFFYRDGVFDKKGNISVKYSNITISEILDNVLKNKNLSYSVNNRQITIFEITPTVNENVKEQLFTISGVINDVSGMPLPGANVLEKGTTNGITTDFYGKFKLNVSSNKAILVVSYIGYRTKEVPVNNQNNIVIILQEDAQALEEVVLIGYGKVKKSDLTGSISSLKPDEINVGANVSVDQMMVGRAAGVQVSQSSSEPGGGLSIRIRGASSINASNEPLYVIDGFPIDNSSNLSSSGSSDAENANGSASIGLNLSPKNPLNTINPNDIKSIEILKDASATAIYGSRGANGVVLITTKRGVNKKMTVNFSSYFGIQNIAKKTDVLSASQYMKFINDVSNEQGDGDVFSSSDISSIGNGTNWQDQVYTSAIITDQNVSISGGIDKSTVYASLDYYKQDGIVKNTGIEKYIGRINFDTQLGEKTKLGFNINTSLINDNNGIDGIQTNENAGPINASQLYDPTESIYNPDGTLTESPNLTINNPVSLIKGIHNNSTTDRTMANFYITYDVIEDLQMKLNLGSDRQNMRRDIYNSTLTKYGGPLGGVADVTTLNKNSYLFEYTLDYKKEFNENNKFNVLGGITYQKFGLNVFSGNISGFPTDNLLTNNLSLGNTNTDNLNSLKEDNTLLSYLGRINYTLYDKFLFTGSIRADGSSRFGSANKYGYFPSFAFGYKLSNEKFIPEIFNELKLRTSWGQTGNQEIPNYASQLTFGAGPSVIYDDIIEGSIKPDRIANPNLKWETTTQFNIGLDASILQNRISTSIDYFSKKTTDLLFNLPLPRSSGYPSYLTNVGKVENKGFEIAINSNNIKTSDFSWETSINFSAIKNKVLDLGRVDQIVTGNIQSVGNTAIIKVGQPLASYYGYVVDGIQQQGDPNPGQPNFVDLDGDGSITPLDQKIIGNPSPDFTYGINNTFKYKNFGLSFFIQGMQGADLLNINVIESVYPANFRRNRLTEMSLDRWTPTNTDARWPSGVNPSSYAGGKVNTLVLQDASYVRLKNVQLSYDLPLNDNSKLFNSLRVYATAQNLFTITNYIGFDPEANSLGRSNVKVDYSSYPLAKTIILGLNAKF